MNRHTKRFFLSKNFSCDDESALDRSSCKIYSYIPRTGSRFLRVITLPKGLQLIYRISKNFYASSFYELISQSYLKINFLHQFFLAFCVVNRLSKNRKILLHIFCMRTKLSYSFQIPFKDYHKIFFECVKLPPDNIR